jgi:hypothetical protein
VGPTPKFLAAQRLVLAGLIGLALASVLLLLFLRSGAERERSTAPVPERAAPAEAPLAEPAPAAEVEQGPAPRAEAADLRTALTTTPLPPAAPEEEEAFDPSAVVGSVACAGQPVADAELFLFDGALERRERREPLAQARSDEGGRFRMKNLAPHVRYALLAQHPDHLPQDLPFFAGHDEEIELERSASVGGTVRERASARPVSGIEVALDRWHYFVDVPERASGSMRARVSALSDAEGRWRLPWAEPGMETFVVSRPGSLPERHEFQVAPEGGEGYAILLGEESVLSLELYALEGGALLADTEVEYDDAPVRTDSHGRIAVPLEAASSDSTVRISLGLPGGCLTQGRVEPEALRAAGTTVVRVPLARGGTVRGRVLDAEDSPVSGAVPRMSGGGRVPSGLVLPSGFWLNPARGSARSGADGRFELRGLPPREGPVEVRAHHPDHPSGRSEPFGFARLGQEVEVEVRLERGATITGRVLLDGEPAGRRVAWSGERTGGWTRANDRGTYRISGVPHGEVRLGARLEEEDDEVERPEDVLLFVEEGAALTCDLELAAHLARIRGRVIDANGEPVAEADVVASLHLGIERTDEEYWGDEEPRAESESDGSFELAVPDAAGLVFDVLAVEGPRRSEAVSVKVGERDLELVLPALATVAVRVVDALHHDPVQGFQLYWRDSDEGSFERLFQGGRSFASGPDGAFVAELPASRLDLVASARSRGYVPARRDGVNLRSGGAPPVEFELERGVQLELEIQVAPEVQDGLKLLRRSRTFIASAEQWAERERGGSWFHHEVRNAQALQPDGNGKVRLDALPSGRYRFYNEPKGFSLRPREFEIPPVAEHRATVTLEVQQRKWKAGGGRK